MSDERLKRILERQQERERKLREKEEAAARAREEQAKAAAAARDQAKASSSASSAADDGAGTSDSARFRKADRHVSGVRSTGYSSETIGKDERVAQLEESWESETKSLGLPTGVEWQKGPSGSWARGVDPQLGRNYKQNATEGFLPMWIFNELELLFGLRRPATKDFKVALKVLTNITEAFLNERGQLQRGLFFAAAFAVRQVVGCPVEIGEETGASAIAVVDALGRKVQQIAERNRRQALPDKIERKLLVDIAAWNEQLRTRIAKDAAPAKVPTDDEALIAAAGGPLFAILDDAAIVCIFEWLHPCDVGSVSQVCRRMSILGSNEMLWRAIAGWWWAPAPPPAVPDGSTFRDLVIQNYLKSRGAIWVGGSGLWHCTNCGSYFWSAKNRPGVCQQAYWEDKGVHTGVVVRPETVVQDILSRKVAVVSDVLYF